jgi:hypothetical protein
VKQGEVSSALWPPCVDPYANVWARQNEPLDQSVIVVAMFSTRPARSTPKQLQRQEHQTAEFVEEVPQLDGR